MFKKLFVSASVKDSQLLNDLRPNTIALSPPSFECMPGTRESLFETFDTWLTDFQAQNILWLKGFPGAGKSAIASTLVERLRGQHRFGSCFFFQRAHAGVTTPAALWCSVAFDLARIHPTVKQAVTAKLEEGVVAPQNSSAKAIFHSLILEPLLSCKDSDLPFGRLPVVVIDALDECGGLDGFQSRTLLLQTLQSWSTLSRNFKLVVTSRDDRLIENMLHPISYPITLLSGNSVDAKSSNDIEIYLRAQFSQIASEYPHSLALSWPEEDIIVLLVAKAAGLFIWAKTVIDFVRITEPVGQLKQIMAGNISVGDLIALYTQILNIAFKNVRQDVLESFKDVIGTIILAKRPMLRADYIYLLEIEPTMLDAIFNGLQTVLEINNDISFKHQSFPDFLIDSTQCPANFLVDLDQQKAKMAFSTIKALCFGLRFNICHLPTSCIRNSEVSNLKEKLEKYVSNHLAYSSTFWAEHLHDIPFLPVVYRKIELLLKEKILFWFELLSLMGSVSIIIPSLRMLIKWCQASVLVKFLIILY